MSVYSLYIYCVLIIWLIQMLFYIFVIKPYVYFNAMAYIASRKLKWEKKAREAELSN